MAGVTWNLLIIQYQLGANISPPHSNAASRDTCTKSFV
jgi:hypothetical protein